MPFTDGLEPADPVEQLARDLVAERSLTLEEADDLIFRAARVGPILRASDTELFRVYAPAELGVDGYPPVWHSVIKHAVRAAAGHRCERCHHPYRNGEHGNGEWSACDDECDHDGPWMIDGFVYETDDPLLTRRPQWPYTTPHRVFARWRILTVHHLNRDKADCRWWNLASLCQKDHLSVQGRVKMDRAFFLEHSEWFKPHAAGFYAWKYENRDVTRSEALERMDELLAYERLA